MMCFLFVLKYIHFICLSISRRQFNTEESGLYGNRHGEESSPMNKLIRNHHNEGI